MSWVPSYPATISPDLKSVISALASNALNSSLLDAVPSTPLIADESNKRRKGRQKHQLDGDLSKFYEHSCRKRKKTPVDM